MSPEIKKWRLAHPDLDVPDIALETVAPFPSLFANDFLAYLQSKDAQAEIVAFVRDIGRELVWAYDLAQKAQHNSDAGRLFTTLIDAATGDGYEFTQRFLRDYAKAHNITLNDAREGPAWQSLVPPGVVNA